MKSNFLPPNAFISPTGENSDEVKKLVNEVIDLVIEFAAGADNQKTTPTAGRFKLDEFSTAGLSNKDIIDELTEVLKGSMNPLSPDYIGHMDSMPTLISCLGEFVSTSINNNLLSHEMSPVFSQMEVNVINRIGKMFGYGSECGGVMTSGGSLANLQALTVARNHKLKVKESGLYGLQEQPVVLVSEASHSSLVKAASVIGLGSSNLVTIKCSQDSKMDPRDLENKIISCIDADKRPFAVVATAGTTVTGNIDPIDEVFKIADKYDLWLHVDAAHAGALVFSEANRHRLHGIEKADSITFNPQKWMYIAKTCAMVIFKDRELLEKEFRISAPYMNETEFTNLGEISLQGTRHADILKLYLSIQHIGLKGYEALINESYHLAQIFINEVEQRPYLVLATEPETNVICFRGEPEYLENIQWDQWNLALQQFVLKELNTFLSLPVHKGHRWLRAVLLNPYLSQNIITRLFNSIDEFYLTEKTI